MKKCSHCKGRIHPQDPHDLCLKCLTPSHQADTCSECLSLPLSVRVTRQDIVTRALNRGGWPSDWKDMLVAREAQIFVQNTEPKVIDNGGKRKRDDSSDTEVLQVEESVDNALNNSKEQGACGDEGDLDVQATLKLILKNMGSFTQKSEDRGEGKKKHKKSKKTKRSKSRERSSYNVGSLSLSLDNNDNYDHDLSQGHQGEHDNESQSDVYSQHPSEIDTEVDLGRGDMRRMYLASLRTLVPSLAHAPQADTARSGHFSYLETKPKENVMPFLPEIMDQTAKRVKVKSDDHKFMIKRIRKYYPTTEPAESGLLAPRSIPSELMRFMPDGALKEKGSTGRTARLRPLSTQGTKDEAANDSFDQATSYMRLSNNIEIGVEVANTLATRLKEQSHRLGGIDMPAEVSLTIQQVNNNLDLLQQAVTDIKSANNDLLKTAIDQYHQSLVCKRDAWLSASNLDDGLVREIKGSDLAIPSQFDPHGERLCLIGDQGVASINDHLQTQKDKAWMQKAGQGQRFQSNRGRSSRGRGRGRPQPRHQAHAQSFNPESGPSQTYRDFPHRSPPRGNRYQNDSYRSQRGQRSPGFRRSYRGRRA